MDRASLDPYLITAEVHYKEILDEGAGIYMWLNPDEKSTLDLLRLVRAAPFKSRDSTELHCTIMYCTKHMPLDIEAPVDQVYGADVCRIDHWIDHKGRNILVFALDSNELQVLHANLRKQALTHSYDAFSPHISVAKDIAWNAEQRLWVDEVNQRLISQPLHITFSPQLRAAPIS